MYLFHYNESQNTISYVTGSTTTFNWPGGGGYAYELNGTNYITFNKTNSRQTPCMAQYNGSAFTIKATETMGRTVQRIMSHNYESSYPYFSFIFDNTNNKVGLYVKSASNIGFGFNADLSVGFTNCTPVSNILSNVTNFWHFPIFGTDLSNFDNFKKVIYASGQWYILNNDQNYTTISLGDRVNSMPSASVSLFISNTEYYTCDSTNNYNIVLKTFS